MSAGVLQATTRPAYVLLVEDNHGDVLLTRRAFGQAKTANELMVAASGEEALEMLEKKGSFADLPVPDLILLDLNLPRMGGHMVLATIKQTPALRRIPVVILSSSRAEQDVISSYDLHANGYVVKPNTLEKFKSVVEKLEEFWFNLVVLPNSSDTKRIL
jgi:CheY-like chemotaxis protein